MTIAISIHTPARGVTDIRIDRKILSIYFNPHSRKGSDVWNRSDFQQLKDFNPHSRKGSDGV